MIQRWRSAWAAAVCLYATSLCGLARGAELVIAENGQTTAIVVVSPAAGEWERRAAEDLVTYLEMLSGARPALADTDASVQAALAGSQPTLVVGQAALGVAPDLQAALQRVAKPQPVLRADAISLRRVGHRVLLAGTNDESHYYAAAELLRRWGCRWYMPTEFGECVPRVARLSLDELDYAYAPPFEVRRYWLSWIGDNAGRPEFMRRNGLNDESVPSGHALGQYTQELVPPGKSVFNVPVAEESTAAHVADKVAAQYAAGQHVMLGIEDGVYESDSPRDRELMALQYDKYFLRPSVTDAFMLFYNGVATRLMQRHPESRAKIGFLAYANLTLPPVRDVTAAPPLVAYLAPIDIDPNHGMDDARSLPRREYKEMLYRWAQVMQGRLVIYDYDQGMLVWRDLPNPSLAALRQDVQHYRKAGILGVDTESRGALATTFLNLFFRAQLLWNPDADVAALWDEFFPNFYGPAAAPMRRYWDAIYKAWDDTLVTEHEYFAIPAIYTPELVEELRAALAEAQQAVAPLRTAADRQAALYVQRMDFTQAAFEVLDAYVQMVQAANTQADYAAAVAAGERGLAARERLTDLNGLFTTYRTIGEYGYAWWPGEVQQYRELLEVARGPRGASVATLPLEWAFRRDPQRIGVAEHWEAQTPDFSWWEAQPDPRSPASRQANPGAWERIRADLYLQAQGLVSAEGEGFTGQGWYQSPVELTAEQIVAPVHVRFPGLFNECWLYVNGQEVAHREMAALWWLADYRFEWDVDLSGRLQAGVNSLVVRIDNPHHFGGLFRRPFLYRPTGQ